MSMQKTYANEREIKPVMHVATKLSCLQHLPRSLAVQRQKIKKTEADPWLPMFLSLFYILEADLHFEMESWKLENWRIE